MTQQLQPGDVGARYRVVSDNDYGGDPDGLVQLAHHLLSPSVDVVAVIASAEAPYSSETPDEMIDRSVERARQIARLCHRDDVPVLEGARDRMAGADQPIDSPGARAIIDQAMDADRGQPLFVTCGGGLTAVASALLLEPAIAERFTLVWIGGPEYPGLAEPPPSPLPVEYNTSIDLVAAQVLFATPELAIWQIPRDAYRQVLVSRAELLTRLAAAGPLGTHLFEANDTMRRDVQGLGLEMGETWILGDNPLVLVTALLSNFEPAPSSSSWVDVERPTIDDDGSYGSPTDGRPVRVFTHIDRRLLLEDLYAKLALHAAGT